MSPYVSKVCSMFSPKSGFVIGDDESSDSTARKLAVVSAVICLFGRLGPLFLQSSLRSLEDRKISFFSVH
jgi:hypothetical protein